MNMSKSYVKDESGKYRLVEKEKEKQEPKVTVSGQLTLEERVKRIEAILFQGDNKK